jgi:hypothetical protein
MALTPAQKASLAIRLASARYLDSHAENGCDHCIDEYEVGGSNADAEAQVRGLRMLKSRKSYWRTPASVCAEPKRIFALWSIGRPIPERSNALQ